MFFSSFFRKFVLFVFFPAEEKVWVFVINVVEIQICPPQEESSLTPTAQKIKAHPLKSRARCPPNRKGPVESPGSVMLIERFPRE